MKGSYRIAKVAGIEVRVHVTFLLLLVFYAWMFYQQGGIPAAIYGVIFILLLFLCVLLHEFGHAFAARVFGIRTPDITLLPFGGLARLERMPTNPWQEIVIAVAGPAVNVVIALALALVMVGRPLGGEIFALGDESNSLIFNLLRINIMLVLFNLIPAFPMDGGRVLRAVLALFMKHARATLIAARVGQGIAILFAVAGLFFFDFNIMLILIAGFVFMAAQQELRYAQMLEAAGSLRVGQVMITQFQTLPDDLLVAGIPGSLSGNTQGVFPLVDERLSLHGLATRSELVEAVRDLPPEARADCVARQIPVVHPETSLEEAAEMVQRLAEPVLPVVNAAGQIVGLIDMSRFDGEAPFQDA